MLESFKDLYEVRKTVRFSLLKQNYEDFCKFENNILKDISFLNSLLKFEDEIKNIQKSNGKKMQDLLSKDILEDIIKNSFQTLKNQICSVIYNKVVFDTKTSERNKRYLIYIKTETWENLDFFIPKDYNNNWNYIPEEDFYKVKDSEIWYAIKFISKLIIDNELIPFNEGKFRNKLKNINKYNSNFWNFFELNTLNPFTVNRWKISEIVNSYELSLSQYKETLEDLNKEASTIANTILSDRYFENCRNQNESDGTVRYLFHIFSNCKNSSEKNIWQINHLILLVNKYESLKNGKKKYTNDEIEPKIKRLNKELRQLAKVRSELLWYQIHLIDNFQTEKFSFLIQSWKYYFVGMKKIWWENNLSQFQEFIDGLEGGNDKLLYLDSMTWGWFKKLFLSKQSDVVFTDGTRIKDLNGSILAKEEEILQLKKWIIEKIEKDINTFISKVTNDIFNEINSKEKIKFIEYLSQKWKKVDNLFKLWKKNKKQLIYGKELKEFCNSLYNFDSIKETYNLTKLEKEYLNQVMILLQTIKDKKYKIGTVEKDLSFLWGGFVEKAFDILDDLKNYFNDLGYKVIQKDVDLEKMLKQVKTWELEIFQIKSKDMPFHQDFINDRNCWIIEEVKNEKSDGFKKDLNTLYFEEFFKDIKNNNRNSRIWADFKIRWINSSENNDYESFWKKEKNQLRHSNNKENIEKFKNRFKRDRYSIEFSINLNATNHLTEEDFNTKISNKLKEKRETWSLRILSLDHGESSFLTYKIYQVEGNKYSIINQGWNFDNFKEIQDWEDKTTKRQENIQIDEKAIPYKDQKILDNYITKYHAMIQDQKRERQVEEAIKHFARKSISKIKEIISADTVDKNKEWVSDITKANVKKFIQYAIGHKEVFSLSNEENSIRNKNKGSNKSIENKKNGVEYSKRIEEFFQNKRLDVISLWEDTIRFDKINIFHILDYEFHFSYIKQEEWFIQQFPDQENIKEKIDYYLNQIQELLDDENKLIAFCNEIKNSFDGKSLADIDKLYNTPFYAYKNNFSLQLEQINNLKKWYASVLVGTISKRIMNGEVDIIVLENNLLYYGVDNSESFQKHMWAENHATFAEALINKLSFCLDKETSESYQFCYPIKVTERPQKFKNKNNGILFFVDENTTSLICPKCDQKLNRSKQDGDDHLHHNNKNPAWDECKKEPFEIQKSKNIVGEYQGMLFHDWDDLATYNIAKKALEYLEYLESQNKDETK